MKKQCLHPIFRIAILGWMGSASGFGVLGHQVVAGLAQDMLSPKARSGIAALMGSANPGGSGVDLPRISTWADDIRMLRPETRGWHYVTIQIGEAGYVPGRGDTANIVTACRRAMRTLARPDADRYAREEALKWVVHLLGDMHQPLHVGEDRDKGGNLVKVKVNRRTYNLHEVWDRVLLERLNLGADTLRILLGRELAADPAFLRRNSQGTVEGWVDETHRKTRNCYLVRGKPMRKGIKSSLERDYNRPNTLVILEQLKLAGVRLAFVLNAAFDSGSAAPLIPSTRLPAGARPDREHFFARAADNGESAPSSLPPGPEGTGKYAWSVHSKVYHFPDCADVARIKHKNLRFSDTPPALLIPHPGCPVRR